jgi:hypothetical protein
MADELSEQEIQEHEKEIAEVTGVVHDGFDVLAGTDPADAQKRRFGRLEYQQSDFTPEPDPVEGYSGPQRGADVKTFDELRAFAEYKEALAKEKYPDYQKLVDTYLVPRLPEIAPEKLREFFMRDDCAELAYRAAKQLERQYRSQAPSLEEVEKMTGDEFSARLDQWMRTARAADDLDEREAWVTKREMRAMAQLSPEGFSRALDFVKSR